MYTDLEIIDRKILSELNHQARDSFSSLAKRLKLGSDTVRHRVERLQKDKLISSFVPVVDLYRLGLTVYKIYLKLAANTDRRQQLVQHLEQQPNTFWVAEGLGRYDLVFLLACRTPREFHALQSEIFSTFDGIVLETNVVTITESESYPRGYIHSRSGPNFILGSQPDQVEIDSIDEGIIRYLSDDGRMAASEIARKCGLSPSAITSRIEKLEQNGVILGYKTQVNYENFGVQLFKVLLYPRTFAIQEEQRFRGFCREHPHITGFVQQIGGCQVEFEVEVPNYGHFYSIIDEIREKFSNYIRTVDYMQIRRDLCHRVPRNLLPADAKVEVCPLAAA